MQETRPAPENQDKSPRQGWFHKIFGQHHEAHPVVSDASPVASAEAPSQDSADSLSAEPALVQADQQVESSSEAPVVSENASAAEAPESSTPEAVLPSPVAPAETPVAPEAGAPVSPAPPEQPPV